jgi:hypothetical protein
MSAWGAWNNAVLTEPFPSTAATQAAAGDRLPYSSRFSGNVSIAQRYPLGGRLKGFTAAEASFVGNRRGVLNGGLGQFPHFGFILIQPRTVGLSVSNVF